MDKRIEELYQQYLSGQLSQEDFEELQHKVTRATDEELWNLMCEDFSLSSELAEMSEESQQRIWQRIHDEIQKGRRRKLVHIINDGDVLRQRPAAVFQKRHLPHRIQLEISRFFDAGFGFRLHVVRQAGPFQRDVRHEGATAGEIMQGKHEGLL